MFNFIAAFFPPSDASAASQPRRLLARLLTHIAVVIRLVVAVGVNALLMSPPSCGLPARSDAGAAIRTGVEPIADQVALPDEERAGQYRLVAGPQVWSLVVIFILRA